MVLKIEIIRINQFNIKKNQFHYFKIQVKITKYLFKTKIPK